MTAEFIFLSIPIEVTSICAIHTFQEVYMTGTIMAVCTSEIKGVQKTNVNSCEFKTEWGLEGDSHAGHWHRQVSLLSYDKVKEFQRRNEGFPIPHGAFGENLVVEGIDFSSFPVGTQFKCGDVLLEMTQIGKECHQGCAIRQAMGDCIMPREGVFARVIEGGIISVGDKISVVISAHA